MKKYGKTTSGGLVVYLLIPSKNRPCQLELLLRSLRENWAAAVDELLITVLYRATSDDYLLGYNKLIEDTRDGPLRIIWKPEKNFCQQFNNWLKVWQDDLVGFFTDDCIFYRAFGQKPSEILDLMSTDIFSFSLRLGLNTTEQYYVEHTQQKHLCHLGYESIDDFIKWNWKIRPANENYGYPFSWDGHFYRATDLIDLCAGLDFTNPRHLESHLSVNINPRQRVLRRNMISPVDSCVFSNAVNVVQEPKIPGGLFYPAGLEELNQRYLQGEVIDFAEMDFGEIQGSHDEVPLKWKIK